jgi:hypothetical protein
LVRTDRIVVPTPAFDDDPSLGERVEDLPVQQLVAKPGVEGFYEAILPRAPGHDVGGLRPNASNPLLHCLGDELGAVIGTDMARDATKDEQTRQNIDDVG